MNIQLLIQLFRDNKLSDYTETELVESMMKFREKNFTTQGLYCYLLYSSKYEKEHQDELRKHLRVELVDKYDSLYPEYWTTLSDISLKEGWFTVELLQEGIEEFSDEYYERWDDALNVCEELTSPEILIDLVMFGLVTNYLEELMNNDNEKHMEQIVENICDEYGVDYSEFDDVYVSFNEENMEWEFMCGEYLCPIDYEEVVEKVKKSLVESN